MNWSVIVRHKIVNAHRSITRPVMHMQITSGPPCSRAKSCVQHARELLADVLWITNFTTLTVCTQTCYCSVMEHRICNVVENVNLP